MEISANKSWGFNNQYHRYYPWRIKHVELGIVEREYVYTSIFWCAFDLHSYTLVGSTLLKEMFGLTELNATAIPDCGQSSLINSLFEPEQAQHLHKICQDCLHSTNFIHAFILGPTNHWVCNIPAFRLTLYRWRLLQTK